MEESSDASSNERLRDAIGSSSELIGAVGGAAVGLVGGPAGAMVGAAAGVFITKGFRRVGLEVYDRLMVPRQKERVGAALAFALTDTEARRAAGEELRDDGFFDAAVGLRSDAEEILEGVLLNAANAYQERKLRHLGAILPSLSFRQEVSAADGHWLTHLADGLTWRQLVVLAIFFDPPEDRLAQRDIDYDESGIRGPDTALRDEVEELGSLGLVGVRNSDGRIVRAGGTMGTIGSIWGAPMGQWSLTDQGRLLVEVARLDEIPRAARDPVLDELT